MLNCWFLQQFFFVGICVSSLVLSKNEAFWCALNIHSIHKICTILDCCFLFYIALNSAKWFHFAAFQLQSLYFDLALALNTHSAQTHTHSLTQPRTMCFVDFPTVLNDLLIIYVRWTKIIQCTNNQPTSIFQCFFTGVSSFFHSYASQL